MVPVSGCGTLYRSRLSHRTGTHPTAAADRAQASLDLRRGPLTRLTLIRRGPDRPAVLHWTAHHWAVDGVSWRVLAEDLSKSYAALAAGEDPSARLPPRTASAGDWARHLEAMARSEGVAAELPRWAALATEAVPALPTDPPRPAALPRARRRS